MSTQSRVVLGASLLGAVSMVTYVHLKQEWEKAKLHDGVIKDLERQELKRLQSQQKLVEFSASEELKPNRQ